MALARTVRWTPWTGAGLEHNRVEWTESGVAAHGVVIGRDAEPFGLTYYLNLSPDWAFLSLALFPIDPAFPSVLLHRRIDGWWDVSRADGERHLDELTDCVDVDLSFTPLTNTLPIRRLNLAAGEARDISVAHLGPPGFRPVVARQRYTCVEPLRRYLYEDATFDFAAELEVDEDGLVLDYPGLFRRVGD